MRYITLLPQDFDVLITAKDFSAYMRRLDEKGSEAMAKSKAKANVRGRTFLKQYIAQRDCPLARAAKREWADFPVKVGATISVGRSMIYYREDNGDKIRFDVDFVVGAAECLLNGEAYVSVNLIEM